MTVSSEDPRQVADALHSAAIRLLRRLRKVDDGTGLSGPRLSALSVLVFRGEMSLGDLASAEQVKPPTMTRLIAALEAEGLVARQANPEDARGVLLRASAKGRKLMQAGREKRVALLVAQVAALSRSKRKLLSDAAALMLELAASVDSAVHGEATDAALTGHHAAAEGPPRDAGKAPREKGATSPRSEATRRLGPAGPSPRTPRRRR